MREAFRFALRSIKPTDAVVVGMHLQDSDQIAANVAHALDAIAHVPTG